MNRLKRAAEKDKQNEINCQQCNFFQIIIYFNFYLVHSALNDCYKNIPQNFFDPGFKFDSNKFSRQVKKMNEFQDEVILY